MSGGEIFLVCFVCFIGALLYENYQKSKLVKEMSDKGYEEEIVIISEATFDEDAKYKTIWKKTKDKNEK